MNRGESHIWVDCDTSLWNFQTPEPEPEPGSVRGGVRGVTDACRNASVFTRVTGPRPGTGAASALRRSSQVSSSSFGVLPEAPHAAAGWGESDRTSDHRAANGRGPQTYTTPTRPAGYNNNSTNNRTTTLGGGARAGAAVDAMMMMPAAARAQGKAGALAPFWVVRRDARMGMHDAREEEGRHPPRRHPGARRPINYIGKSMWTGAGNHADQ